MTAAWEHFGEWKRINNEGEQGVVSLETMIRGTCEPTRLLDLVENFILFDQSKGALVKLVGKNHQVLGVNAALAGLQRAGEARQRLGVFWHTQGSGKSVSMIFFAQKILRTVSGNWTFVIVTDRQELDEQIYGNFAQAGAVSEKQARAESSEDLRRLLREDHRYVFTLIQKFRVAPGERFPVLSDRSDVIVITDEAHRSQYDTFAMNMRIALPNAAFIGFTGTPLLAGEEKTREVFGDYVSVYSFEQSIRDGATVPLYYENRVPELQLTNEDLGEDLERLVEDAALDESQERALEREFAREYHLITRDDRLERIAEDLAAHFVARGQWGKAMVVCIDKATAVRMYDKVQRHWYEQLVARRREHELATTVEARRELEERIALLERTDMAVVVSQGQNEVAELAARGADIIPHRKRMVTEDLAKKFKNPDDPLAIVFVCAMWMTGFDVPSCSTIYLDKPLRNHTLMQTIARANRVWGDKVNGLIVDYVGIFRDLRRALAIYNPGDQPAGAMPVASKAELVDALKIALADTTTFCATRGLRLAPIGAAQGFARIKLLEDAIELLLADGETKLGFLARASRVARLFRAILPDPVAADLAPTCALLRVLAERLAALVEPPDISAIITDVESLLNRSVAADAYVIREARGPDARTVDLSQIDFDKLKAAFAGQHQRTMAERLRALLNAKLATMVRRNRSRIDFQERFERLIAEYNTGSMNVQEFFDELITLARSLSDEDRRAIGEQLSEEELAIFDLLTRPEPDLTEAETKVVKQAARDLLATLKAEKLVLDWRKQQRTRQAVRVCIEEVYDRELPNRYDKPLFDAKVETTFRHVYESYYGDGRSVYTVA